MDKITLKGMEFYARHGAMKEEQILGQKFTVDIIMYLSLDKAGALITQRSILSVGRLWKGRRSG